MVNEVASLVSTEWLDEHLGSEGLQVLDASWYLPTENRDPKQEFTRKHIMGAGYFDINSFSDPDHHLPHMVPSEQRFCVELSKLGISDGDHVVIYDGMGLFSAARAWWLLKLFGFSKVSVLNGGLPKWISEDRFLTSDLKVPVPGNVTSKFQKGFVSDWKQVKFLMNCKSKQILDARPSERFKGYSPEPRPGLRSGHIPGSTNICYKNLLNNDCTLKSKGSLLEIFKSKNVDLNSPIITSCGSGVTAAILYLALFVVGANYLSIYDGSWAEWGLRDDLNIGKSL